MTVVRNEIESGREQSAGACSGQRMKAAAYDWHNYGKETIGARSDIERVDIERLQAFYRTYYQPDNAVLDRSPGNSIRTTTLAADREVLRRDSAGRRARCPASTPTSRCRTASARSRCAASATRSSSPLSITRCRGAHPDAVAIDALGSDDR